MGWNKFETYFAKKIKLNEIDLTLEIDAEGNALPVNLNLLNLDEKTEQELVSKIKGMPKWETNIQGYKVTGFAVIPIIDRCSFQKRK